MERLLGKHDEWQCFFSSCVRAVTGRLNMPDTLFCRLAFAFVMMIIFLCMAPEGHGHAADMSCCTVCMHTLSSCNFTVWCYFKCNDKHH